MAWDLRGALLKKQEVESARLADFEFRQRARTFRLLAEWLDPGLEPSDLVRRIAQFPDQAILAELAARHPVEAADLQEAYLRFSAEARISLIEELGDPSPHRLA